MAVKTGSEHWQGEQVLRRLQPVLLYPATLGCRATHMNELQIENQAFREELSRQQAINNQLAQRLVQAEQAAETAASQAAHAVSTLKNFLRQGTGQYCWPLIHSHPGPCFSPPLSYTSHPTHPHTQRSLSPPSQSA
ncbi:hypothetical protein HaLaN_17469 [Haematococcus lacustris]|uniref:Uncharacterized protein n=1 Tax=Haematococcus lacustris TaxID=44745 RepID=A0A699ZGQ4_HAELA|nr:hypothetical protein HaLaN_17469 [Haematococcus lacustris]